MTSSKYRRGKKRVVEGDLEVSVGDWLVRRQAELVQKGLHRRGENFRDGDLIALK